MCRKVGENCSLECGDLVYGIGMCAMALVRLLDLLLAFLAMDQTPELGFRWFLHVCRVFMFQFPC